MMGKQNNDQNKLFYSFNLEQMVPDNHLLRHINAVLDLKDLRAHLQPFYSSRLGIALESGQNDDYAKRLI